MSARALRRVFVLVVVALLAGCASGAPPTRLMSIEPLVGKWQGTIAVGMGPPQFYYLTVNPDASIVATWGANWQWGKITVNGTEGARFELDHITTGTLLYYSGPSGKAIQMTPDIGGWYVWITPVK
ncbi:MAG TPA: hypothetical protein VE482_02400 [Candidatus Eisenbacteria bacterium]|nr:hypothetical protein [Candidatus Eisenbacteria bacterium]